LFHFFLFLCIYLFIYLFFYFLFKKYSSFFNMFYSENNFKKKLSPGPPQWLPCPALKTFVARPPAAAALAALPCPEKHCRPAPRSGCPGRPALSVTENSGRVSAPPLPCLSVRQTDTVALIY
jgi:hypothetical protein